MVHKLIGLLCVANACGTRAPATDWRATDAPTSTDDPASTWVDVPFIRTIATLHRDASGRSAPDSAPAAVCPAEFEGIGALRDAQVCLGEQTGGVVILDRDEWGELQQESEEGARCELLGPHLGGFGRGAVCQIEVPLSTLYVDRDRDRVPLAALPALHKVCPPESRHVGGFGLNEACLPDRPGAVAVLSRTLDGELVRELPQLRDACPSGWTIAGGQQFSAVCLQDQAGAVIWLTPSEDQQPWFESNRASLCPPEWSLVGGTSTDVACASTVAHEIAVIDVETGESSDSDPDRLACPAPFIFQGKFGTAMVCVRQVE